MTEPDNQQTRPKNHQSTRVRAKARPNNPPPTPRLPHVDHSSPVGCLMTPHRCPHCEVVPDDVFPLPPYPGSDPDPPPNY